MRLQACVWWTFYKIFLISVKLSKTIQIVNLLDDMNCGATSNPISGVVLVSSRNPPTQFSSDINCVYTMFATKRRQSVEFKMTHFDFFPNDCAQAYIKIYNGLEIIPANLLKTICPGDDPSTVLVTSTSEYMTVDILATFTGTPPRANFCGYFSAFEDRSVDSICSFPADEILCANKRCVYKDLTCDGLDACGDKTDESTAPPASCSSDNIQPSVDFCPFTTTVTGPTAVTQSTAKLTTGMAAEHSTAITTAQPTDSNISIHKVAVISTILTLAGALFLAYLFYWLLSIAAFNRAVTGCLRKFLLYFSRNRRKISRNMDNEKKTSKPFGSKAKITPMEPEDLE